MNWLRPSRTTSPAFAASGGPTEAAIEPSTSTGDALSLSMLLEEADRMMAAPMTIEPLRLFATGPHMEAAFRRLYPSIEIVRADRV